MVLESAGCVDTVADMTEVVGEPRRVIWNGLPWREVVVQLTKNGGCRLRLLAPTHERARLDMAASVLSGGLAACFHGTRCEDRVFPLDIYKAFGKLK